MAKYLVLVQRQQCSQAVRIHLIDDEQAGRMIAGEPLVGRETLGLLGLDASFGEARAYFGLRQTPGEGLRLSDAVGPKPPLMILEPRRPPAREHKGGTERLGALMEQLVRGVLAIRAHGPPEDGPRRLGDGLTVRRDRLPVAFHLELLEIGRELGQGIGVGQEGVGLGAQHVLIPKFEEG